MRFIFSVHKKVKKLIFTALQSIFQLFCSLPKTAFIFEHLLTQKRLVTVTVIKRFL
jgi:hypothetical protein